MIEQIDVYGVMEGTEIHSESRKGHADIDKARTARLDSCHFRWSLGGLPYLFFNDRSLDCGSHHRCFLGLR